MNTAALDLHHSEKMSVSKLYVYICSVKMESLVRVLSLSDISHLSCKTSPLRTQVNLHTGQLTQAFKMKNKVCVKGKHVMSLIAPALVWVMEIIASRRTIALGTVGIRESARC